MPSRDESNREIQKMLADSGLIKELLTLDGVMSIADRLGDIQRGNTALSWWVLHRTDKDSSSWFFGSG
jgi:hypothetical protein